MCAVARFGFGVVLDFAVARFFLEGAKHCFHYVRGDTLHLSETVSGFFERCDYSILDDKTIFVAKYFLLN